MASRILRFIIILQVQGKIVDANVTTAPLAADEQKDVAAIVDLAVCVLNDRRKITGLERIAGRKIPIQIARSGWQAADNSIARH